MNSMGTLAATWGIGGILLLLSSAAFRLSPLAMDALSTDLVWYHWTSLTLVVLAMAYAEGYVGFQKKFSPRVAARARYLQKNPRPVLALLAPLFCMGYFHATRRRKIRSISLTLGIILLVLLVRLLPQPWRGIVDAGVVIGLAWGAVSLLVLGIRALTADRFDFSPEVPGFASPET